MLTPETLAAWREDAEHNTPTDMTTWYPANERILALLDALSAAEAEARRAEEFIGRVERLENEREALLRRAEKAEAALDRVRALSDEWEARGRSARQDQQAANRADEAEHAEYWAGMADATFEALDDLKTALDGA